MGHCDNVTKGSPTAWDHETYPGRPDTIRVETDAVFGAVEIHVEGTVFEGVPVGDGWEIVLEWPSVTVLSMQLVIDARIVTTGILRVTTSPVCAPSDDPLTVTTGGDVVLALTVLGGGDGDGGVDVVARQMITDHEQAVSGAHAATAISGLATVARSGVYSDLSGTPPIPASPGDIGAASAVHTHQIAEVTNLGDTLGAKADLVGGKIPTSQIPALATTEVYTVASEVAMLALDVQRGDIAIRTDLSTTFILAGEDPTLLSDWVELPAPAAPVSSVQGQTGAVTLGPADVGAAATVHSHTAAQVSGLAAVAVSGAWADVSGKPALVSNAGGVTGVQALSQGDFDLLPSPDPDTLYVIVEDD